VKRTTRNAWRRWAGKYFDGWLRKWAIEAAFEAGWRMSRKQKIRAIKYGQEVMTYREAAQKKKRLEAESAKYYLK